MIVAMNTMIEAMVGVQNSLDGNGDGIYLKKSPKERRVDNLWHRNGIPPQEPLSQFEQGSTTNLFAILEHLPAYSRKQWYARSLWSDQTTLARRAL